MLKLFIEFYFIFILFGKRWNCVALRRVASSRRFLCTTFVKTVAIIYSLPFHITNKINNLIHFRGNLCFNLTCDKHASIIFISISDKRLKIWKPIKVSFHSCHGFMWLPLELNPTGCRIFNVTFRWDNLASYKYTYTYDVCELNTLQITRGWYLVVINGSAVLRLRQPASHVSETRLRLISVQRNVHEYANLISSQFYVLKYLI